MIFTLDLECTRNAKAPATAPEKDKYNNAVIYSKDLQWIPQGKQAERFAENPIQCVDDDIIVAKAGFIC